MLQFITHKNDKFDYLNGAKEALKGGCRWIQLRMKGSTADEVIATGAKLRELCNEYGATLIIDDYVELVEAIKADGVHLGKNDMSIVEAREILGEDIIIGGTANTFEDVEQLIADGVNYIGLGPYKFTTTKQGLSAILGLEGYQSISDQYEEREYTTPIVAIGGITHDDIDAILETGIDGIALSGAILNAENPELETKKVMNIIKQHYNE